MFRITKAPEAQETEAMTDEEKDQQDALEEAMNPDIEVFEATCIINMRTMASATRRRYGKRVAKEARLYSNQARRNGDRQSAKSWGSLAWQLQNDR